MGDEEDHISPEDKELEAELSRLVPSKLKVNFFDELVRDQERIESAEKPEPRRKKWMLLTLVTCALVFCGTTIWKIRGISPAGETVVQETSPAPVPSKPNDFVPVSSEGYLINAASDGIIDSEEGPRERFELKYEDFHHWHNPDTSTNIRIYSPRREIITIPVETD